MRRGQRRSERKKVTAAELEIFMAVEQFERCYYYLPQTPKLSIYYTLRGLNLHHSWHPAARHGAASAQRAQCDILLKNIASDLFTSM